MKVGIGYDAHRFKEGRRLIIGGVQIDYHLGLDGHSDADVLTHALCDAILGAIKKGDIGKLFPPEDPAYEDADSIKLLIQVGNLARESGYEIIDADCVVIAQKPKLSYYREEMRCKIANALKTDIDNIGIKATTTEGMGFTGRLEGIVAHAVVLVDKISRD